MNPVSLNNRFIVEPYSGDRALRAKASNGFAIVEQKVSLVGLKLLADAKIVMNGQTEYFDRGALVYIKEGLLFTQPWGQNVYKSEAIEGNFIIVDSIHVDFVCRT